MVLRGRDQRDPRRHLTSALRSLRLLTFCLRSCPRPPTRGLRAPIDKTLSMWPARCSHGIPATGADTSVSAHRVPRSGTRWWENAVGLIDRAMFAAPKGPPVPGEVPDTGVATSGAGR